MRTKTLDQFTDVAAVLDAALTTGGGLYTCLSYGSAVHWRQRAYELRSLLRKLNAQKVAPGQGVSTKYDSITINISKNSPVARIELLRPKGVFTDLNGNVIDVGLAKNLAQDPMYDEAEALLRELGGDIEIIR